MVPIRIEFEKLVELQLKHGKLVSKNNIQKCILTSKRPTIGMSNADDDDFMYSLFHLELVLFKAQNWYQQPQ